MRLESRKGIATYMEVFILCAAVFGLSGVVYTVATQYARSAQGANVTITNAMIKQGANVAVEGLTVANTGTVAFTSVTVATSGLASSASYCLSALNPETGAMLSSSCPAGTNPNPISMTLNLLPGQSIVATITIESGGLFVVGTTYTVMVSTSPAAQSSTQVVAIAA